VTFLGRAVDGETGAPIHGAIVYAFTENNPRTNLARLTDEDWLKLDALSMTSSTSEPGAAVLSKLHAVGALSRTDASGRFEFSQGAQQNFGAVTAFARDKLPITRETFKLKPTNYERVDLGDVPLFDAAYVMVEPSPPQGVRSTTNATWTISKEDDSAAKQLFEKYDKWEDRRWGRNDALRYHEKQRVMVPANLLVNLKFFVLGDNKVFVDPSNVEVKLTAGEVHDLGKLSYATNRSYEVLVVDEQGNPLEGIPIRAKTASRNVWVLPVFTDRNGVARHFAQPGEEVEAWVDLPLPAGKFDEEPKAKYTVPASGESSAEPCRFILNAVQIELLRGQTVKKPGK
jgi:hypothetical protein